MFLGNQTIKATSTHPQNRMGITDAWILTSLQNHVLQHVIHQTRKHLVSQTTTVYSWQKFWNIVFISTSFKKCFWVRRMFHRMFFCRTLTLYQLFEFSLDWNTQCLNGKLFRFENTLRHMSAIFDKVSGDSWHEETWSNIDLLQPFPLCGRSQNLR